MLSLSFICHRIVDLTEARKLIVNAVELFKQEVNNDLKIRPYLTQYPFESGTFLYLYLLGKKTIEVWIIIKFVWCLTQMIS